MSYEDSYINANFVRGFDGNPKVHVSLCMDILMDPVLPKTRCNLLIYLLIDVLIAITKQVEGNTLVDSPYCSGQNKHSIGLHLRHGAKN